MNSVLTIFLAIIHSVLFAVTAYTQREHLTAYRNISWLLMLQCLFVVAGVIALGLSFMDLLPTPMNWSWLHILGSSGANVLMVGGTIPYYGIIYCLLLFLALPAMAREEEKIFRDGTRSWFKALNRSIVFGLFHMLVGVPLGFAIALIGAGLFFSYKYFRGGLELSTQAHFQYNVIIVTILTFGAISSIIPSH